MKHTGNHLDYGFLECARKMPPLRHKVGEVYDVRRSEVAQWLVKQPDIMEKLVGMAKSKGVIVYDPDTGTWKGADT